MQFGPLLKKRKQAEDHDYNTGKTWTLGTSSTEQAEATTTLDVKSVRIELNQGIK